MLIQMNKWLPQIRPPRTVCPEEFCFHWCSTGGWAEMSGKAFTSVRDAMRSGTTVHFPDGGCACSFGLCTRKDPVNGDHDWYEPHEPRLRDAGLPWFYFIPGPGKLVPERRAEYEREAGRLWNHEG